MGKAIGRGAKRVSTNLNWSAVVKYPGVPN